MRLRPMAATGILSLLVVAAFVVPASGGPGHLVGLNQASFRSGDGPYPYPYPHEPKPCHGLKGPPRAQCQRRLAAERRCLKLRGRIDPVCTEVIVFRLASDETEGRQNGTPGSALARSFLIDQLRPISNGLNTSASGDAAYTQSLPGGTNVVSVIPGTDLANEYVVVGAHYDHLGSFCAYKTPGDRICNGATDNAAGVAAVLGIGRAIAARSNRPRRSVVLALWDREEDGLIGSRHYVQNPLVPLASTAAYVNFDIQGANLLPSLRNTTFAVAAETGGSRLQSIVRSAIDRQPLDTPMLSSIFGQFRSDYASFLGVRVPSVFFTDATGPCYHTSDDEIEIVDFEKLNKQIGTALAVTRDLANTNTPPAFVSGAPLATYDDLVAFAEVVERGSVDIGRFSAADQATIQSVRDNVRRLVAEGRAAFGSDDVFAMLGYAASMVNLLTHGECDGFLAASHGRHG
jgi:hypothetical protein